MAIGPLTQLMLPTHVKPWRGIESPQVVKAVKFRVQVYVDSYRQQAELAELAWNVLARHDINSCISHSCGRKVSWLEHLSRHRETPANKILHYKDYNFLANRKLRYGSTRTRNRRGRPYNRLIEVEFEDLHFRNDDRDPNTQKQNVATMHNILMAQKLLKCRL